MGVLLEMGLLQLANPPKSHIRPMSTMRRCRVRQLRSLGITEIVAQGLSIDAHLPLSPEASLLYRTDTGTRLGLGKHLLWSLLLSDQTKRFIFGYELLTRNSTAKIQG